MIKKTGLLITLLLIMTSLATESMAQEALKPRPSPLGLVTMKFEDTYVKITYGRPHKRDREIFGNPDLVPYGKVWRTGANEATEITITEPVTMAGKRVEPGTYTLFTIPEEDQWTIILNEELGQWGSYNYKEDRDVLRFTVPTKETDVVYEPFTIEFNQSDDSADIQMMWDQTMVEIPLEFL
ncbi:MAG: DUF2911 domain-containing protein [Candidatus Cyclobacteriaceae bacterium M3_2C_046]